MRIVVVYNKSNERLMDMTIKNMIGFLMEKNSVANSTLAKRLGLTNAAMWARVNHKNQRDMPFSIAVETLRALDYKVVIVPANKKLGEDCYEIDGREEE